jgi:hypothetical protein
MVCFLDDYGVFYGGVFSDVLVLPFRGWGLEQGARDQGLGIGGGSSVSWRVQLAAVLCPLISDLWPLISHILFTCISHRAAQLQEKSFWIFDFGSEVVAG